MKRESTIRGRFYTADGKRYPSVTTILSCVNKPALVAWSANMERALIVEEAAKFYGELKQSDTPLSAIGFATNLVERVGKKKAHQRELEKAGDIGTQAHAMIEWALKTELCHKVGPSPEIGPEAAIAYSAWQRWRESVDFKPLLVESGVVSHKYGYAGTTDFLCAELNGVETLCDWKTGKRVYYEAHLQNAAYRVAAREMGLADPKAGLLLRLPKTKEDPGFEAVPARDEQECFEIFLSCMRLWKDMQADDKWLKAQEEKQKEAVQV